MRKSDYYQAFIDYFVPYMPHGGSVVKTIGSKKINSGIQIMVLLILFIVITILPSILVKS